MLCPSIGHHALHQTNSKPSVLQYFLQRQAIVGNLKCTHGELPEKAISLAHAAPRAMLCTDDVQVTVRIHNVQTTQPCEAVSMQLG